MMIGRSEILFRKKSYTALAHTKKRETNYSACIDAIRETDVPREGKCCLEESLLALSF